MTKAVGQAYRLANKGTNEEYVVHPDKIILGLQVAPPIRPMQDTEPTDLKVSNESESIPLHTPIAAPTKVS